MNENLDLTKILEECPVGTEFYSVLHDKVFFRGINFDNDYPVTFDSPIMVWSIGLTKEGRALQDVGECIIFPSKDQRDWSKFVRFWDKPKIEKFDPKTFQPFDRVLIKDNSCWTADFFSYIAGQWVNCVGGVGTKCIPYNAETEHLVGTEDDCPEYYKWWEE